MAFHFLQKPIYPNSWENKEDKIAKIKEIYSSHEEKIVTVYITLLHSHVSYVLSENKE